MCLSANRLEPTIQLNKLAQNMAVTLEPVYTKTFTGFLDLELCTQVITSLLCDLNITVFVQFYRMSGNNKIYTEQYLSHGNGGIHEPSSAS